MLGQPCLPGRISLSTQEQIDNFQTNYPTRTEIDGRVEIAGNDITNLDGLNVLTAIGNILTIGNNDSSNPALTRIVGLSNLIFIGNSLHVRNNAVLTSLNGLKNLTYIGPPGIC